MIRNAVVRNTVVRNAVVRNAVVVVNLKEAEAH